MGNDLEELQRGRRSFENTILSIHDSESSQERIVVIENSTLIYTAGREYPKINHGEILLQIEMIPTVRRASYSLPFLLNP